MQFTNKDYKIGYGESQREVAFRMNKAINSLLETYQGKRIAIITHATAIMYYLSLYCQTTYGGNCTFKDKIFFDGKFRYLETFKLEFNANKELIGIKNIRKD